MSKTFTDEDGKQWRLATCHGALHFAGKLIIEPIPAPPQTEAEILAEMDEGIRLALLDAYGSETGTKNWKRMARVLIAACQKLRGLEGK